MRTAAVALCVLLMAAATGRAETPGDAQLGVVKAYLEARAATMQATATAADVDRALALCVPTVAYQHPRVGIAQAGVDVLRSGMRSFLGASRNASIQLTSSLQGRDMVAVQTAVSFEARDGDSWKPVSRSQAWVFEFDGARIQRIIEYW